MQEMRHEGIPQDEKSMRQLWLWKIRTAEEAKERAEKTQ